MQSPEPALIAEGMTAGYGGASVVRDCDIRVPAGATVALLGANGAGKTTLVSAVSGRLRQKEGKVYLHGSDISKLPAYRRARAGVAHVPQGREIFASLTVWENLLVSARGRADAAWDLVESLFPWLRTRAAQRAGTLSGGEQQMLAIARALLTGPRLLILDEPSLGLAPHVSATLFRTIADLSARTDLSVLLVEQQTRWVWQSDQVDMLYVLRSGTIAAVGTPDEITESLVREAYLGV